MGNDMGTNLIAAISIVALPLSIWCMMSMAAATSHVIRGGFSGAREFSRAGFTLGRFFSATVRRQDSSSLVPTRAGVRARVRNGRIVVSETRAISKDVF